MRNKRILVVGTSRLHRPFAKRVNGMVVNAEFSLAEIIFPKIGYFHSVAEIDQVLRFLLGLSVLPLELLRYIFRVEPRATTPLNEFNEGFELAIRDGVAWIPEFKIDDIDSIIIEVSSLTVNIHTPTGVFLHTNPNIQRNVPYSEIYPQGYYKLFEKNLPVLTRSLTLNETVHYLSQIKKSMGGKTVVVIGHLSSPGYPNPGRDKLNGILSEACKVAGCIYFDVSVCLDQFGFAIKNSITDIHHLSDAGEQALANLLFNSVISAD